MSNKILNILNSDQVALGAWVNSTDPLVAEIFATVGCDWVFIDTEHEPIGRRDLTGLIMAFKGSDCTPVVRVPGNHPEDIKWILDLGAGGIVIPNVVCAGDVATAVRHTRYYPLGERGMGALRASKFGTDKYYYETANDRTALIIQAENVKFLENIDEILAEGGYDVVFVGPMDLSQTMGYPGNPGHPDVQRAIEEIIGRVSRAGIPVAVTVGGPQDVLKRYEQGARLFILGSDYRFVRDGALTSLADARRVLATVMPTDNSEILIRTLPT